MESFTITSKKILTLVLIIDKVEQKVWGDQLISIAETKLKEYVHRGRSLTDILFLVTIVFRSSLGTKREVLVPIFGTGKIVVHFMLKQEASEISALLTIDCVNPPPLLVSEERSNLARLRGKVHSANSRKRPVSPSSRRISRRPESCCSNSRTIQLRSRLMSTRPMSTKVKSASMFNLSLGATFRSRYFEKKARNEPI